MAGILVLLLLLGIKAAGPVQRYYRDRPVQRLRVEIALGSGYVGIDLMVFCTAIEMLTRLRRCERYGDRAVFALATQQFSSRGRNVK